jgi:hypothetical protein
MKAIFDFRTSGKALIEFIDNYIHKLYLNIHLIAYCKEGLDLDITNQAKPKAMGNDYNNKFFLAKNMFFKPQLNDTDYVNYSNIFFNNLVKEYENEDSPELQKNYHDFFEKIYNLLSKEQKISANSKKSTSAEETPLDKEEGCHSNFNEYK